MGSDEQNNDENNKKTPNNDGNVVDFDPLARKKTESDKKNPEQPRKSWKNPVKPSVRHENGQNPFINRSLDGENAPLLNILPVTKYMLAVFIAIHLVVVFLLSDNSLNWLYTHLGFIPGRFTGTAIFEPLALLTPLSHVFLHGSWLHLAMNSVMLLAFGSGIERWIGGRKMVGVFVVSALFGVGAHFALNSASIFPVIGASGGLSGLFAVALIMLNRFNPNMSGRYGMWPLILSWVGISVIFGVIGSPDGADVAWAAHVGGFLGGFVAVKLLRL